MKDPCVDGNVLYLERVSVNILLVILHYDFGRCSHWKKPGKGSIEIICIIFSIACEFTVISK